jgi:D-sedoheptulose 7-phosphate isomerase
MNPAADRERRRREAAGLFADGLAALQEALGRLGAEHEAVVYELAEAVLAAWRRGGKLLIAGNGGSAADAQHIAAELVGRYLQDRPGYAALALTTNTSTLTAVANDYGYDAVFARQVEALGREGDVLLVLSTSGNSPNCVAAVDAARARGLRTFGFLGKGGGALRGRVDAALVVPSEATPRIQEIHIAMAHLLCQLLERWRQQEGGAP